ncbi:MAG: hypothetical protein AABY22_24710 [Nanoarchaeota archaeon]
MSNGKLYKTKVTVIGPMQYLDGRNIREYFKEELGKIGMVVFDHYNKPFVEKYIEENETTSQELKYWLETEQYDKIAEKRPIRSYDLSLIERSDIIIFHFIPGVVTTGSWEEFFLANRSKRPVFFITEGGKKKTPFWVFWTIPHKYIYSSKEEVIEIIKKIDSGEKEIDSDRWRLLREEFR